MFFIKAFTFSPFQENTYILHDNSKECVIIDPGCYDEEERQELADFIESNELYPVRLLNTHCHLDHVFGNAFVADKYGLRLEINKNELQNLNSFEMVTRMYNLNGTPSPQPSVFLEEGDSIKFGDSTLEILFTPGHSAGSITFFNRQQKIMIVGDVLFNGSIGRTDFPGGDYNTLISSIKEKLIPLGDDYIVYNGHGPSTSIGFEKNNNPFL